MGPGRSSWAKAATTGALVALTLAPASPARAAEPVVAAAAAAERPALTAADVPGFRAAGQGARYARAALGRPFPRALRGAATAGSSLRGSGRRVLLSGLFTTSSAAQAKRAFAQTRRGSRLGGFGDQGSLRLFGGRRLVTATVIVRRGRVLGVVRLQLPQAKRRTPNAELQALAFAGTLAAKLERAAQASPFQATLDGIGADGSITPALALRAFAIAYGPLPGVSRPRGRDLGTPQSATLAMQLVARVWDRISAAQRAAVERRLGAPHDGGSAALARSSAAPLVPNARYQAIADRYRTFYAGKLPGYNPDVRVFTTADEITDARGVKAWADALPVNAAGQWGVGAPSYCRVRVPPTGQREAGGPFFQLIMAHEVFHCFQFQIMTAWRQRSAWLIEGMADWAATSAYRTTAAVGAGPYRLYLATADALTFGRSYDGTGVWHWLDESHGVGSLWPNVPLILNAADDAGSFIVAGGGDLSFQETWASAALRLSGAGSAWRQTRPYALARLDPPAPLLAVTDDTVLESARFQAKLAVVTKDASKPLVSMVGLNGRFRAAIDRRDFGLLDDERWFCFGRCVCPPRRSGEIPAHERVNAAVAVALTGGALPGRGRVVYHDLDEFCRARERTPRRAGPSGPAESNGDPHLTTFDGLHYDFQAAGEFVLAQGDGLAIQARQEPYGSSRTVTVNTQIAARVGDRRVTVSAGSAADATPVVRVDGTVDPLPAGAPRAFGGGTLMRESGGWVDVTWADGSTLVVRPVGRWGVATTIELAGERAGRVRGLLGDFDGRPGDDLATRGGRAIRYTARASSGWTGLTRYDVAQEFDDRFFDALYDDVGESWRISQRESLFDYGAGQSTKTFTLRRVPAKPVSPEELRRQQRAEAERICRAAGVTQPGPLADCIVDVAATGNAAFAEEAKIAQDAASVLWQRLAAGSDISGRISAARGGDGGLVVGWNRDAGGNVNQLAAVRIDAAGRPGGAETIANADGSVGLYAAADGGVRALSAEIPLDGRSSGVYQYARGGDGAWSPLGLVTGFGSSYAGAPVGLGLPDGGTVTVSPMAGVARVFRGAPAVDDGVLVPVPEGCYGTSPQVARDGGDGAVWIAWLQWDCPQVGVFVARYDPATGAFSPPLQAPGSAWGSGDYPSLGLDDPLAMSARGGRDGVWLAYESGSRGDVALWRIGSPRATTIRRRGDEARSVRLSADPGDGRLWALWQEGGRYWVQRTTAAGALDGAARPVASPRNGSGDLLRLDDIEISAHGGGLDLVHGLRRGDTPGALSFAHITP